MTRLLIHLVPLAAICATGCGTYQANRAALTPHQTPQMHSGHPLDGTAELGFGASSLAHTTDLGEGDPEAGVEVPGTQLRGDARLRLSDVFALGLVYENGLDETARRPKEEQPPVDEGNVQGYGVTADISIRTRDPRFRVGLGFDMMIWDVPYVEYLSCAPGDPACFPDGVMIMSRGTDRTETFGVSVTPSYRTGNMTVFGGLTARQHPTIQQKGTETDPILEGEGDVESGPFNVVVSAGLEYGLMDGAVEASLVVYQDLTQDPVRYGPGIGAMVTVPIGRRTPRAASSEPAPAPAPAPAPSAAPGAAAAR